VVQTLVHVLLENVAVGAQRAALEVAALVHTVTERLLAAVLPGEDAHALFRWLAGISMTFATPSGLRLHDLARQVIDADLKWRNAERRAEHVERARTHVLEIFWRAEGAARQRAGFEAVYLSRDAPVFSPADAWSDAGRPRVELAQPSDAAELRALVSEKEGQESAALAAGWMQRQPDAVYVYRDDTPAMAGLSIVLTLGSTAGHALAWDPGAAAAWRALAVLGALRPGETAVLARHVMSRASYQMPSPMFVEYLALFTRLQVTTPGIRYGAYIVAGPETWAAMLKPMGVEPLPEGDFVVGGRTYGVFANDFRRMRPIDFFIRAQRATSSGEPYGLPPAPVQRLRRHPFGVAVHDALRDLHDDRRLGDNPLTSSRLVWVRVGGGDRMERVRALRALVFEAVDSLSGRERPLRELLHRTYLEPAPVQKEVAYDLGLSFSSYRRGLAHAMVRVADRLWSQEID
jgi:hypothetical protein